MPKNFSISVLNALLMVAPVALLGGVGFLLQNRKPAVLTVAGPFEPYIRKVRLVPLKPKEVHNGYDTKVEVELGARGKLPGWWETGFTSGGSNLNNAQLVAVKNGVSRPVGYGSPSFMEPHLENSDKTQPRWITTYFLVLAPIPASRGEVHLRHRVQMADSVTKYGKPMWLDTVVRQSGKSTQVPTVSHDPHLALTRWTLDRCPPIEEAGKGDRKWRLRVEYQQKHLPRYVNSLILNEDFKLCDAAGKEASFPYRKTLADRFEGFSVDYTTYRSKPVVQQGKVSFIRDFGDKGVYVGLNHTPKPPLWIQGDAWWGNHWPLKVSIPFRDAQGKVLLSPRSAPQFRVISALRRAASATEAQADGTDTVVEVILGGLPPKEEVPKWTIEGSFSEHLEDAKGRLYWTFPFKSSPSRTMVVSVDHNTSRMTFTVKYHFILASISKNAGKLTFHAEVSANGSRRVPVSVVVRP